MREQYQSVQYLRAIAALMVVVHHARNPYPWFDNPLADYHAFARGVDVFFLISGFIMAVIGSREPPRQFALKRLIRVVPIYWMATTLLLLVLAVRYGLDSDLLRRWTLSMLFVPHLDGQGEPFPLLPPGWTLNLEMFFYGIFLIGLLMRRPVIVASAVLVSCVLLGFALTPQATAARVYSSPLLLEFVAGMVVGLLRHRIAALPWLAWALPVGAALLFMTHGWALLLVAATCILVGALAWESRMPRLQGLKTLGDASYFLYLSHHFVVSVLFTLWRRLDLQGPLEFISMLAASLVLSILVAVAGHRLVERPLTRWLQQRFVPARSRPAGAPLAPPAGTAS
jgi:exopolysaccharide production protein ExoZ